MTTAQLLGFRMLADCMETYRRPGKTCDCCDGPMTADDGDAGDGLCEQCWRDREQAQQEEYEFLARMNAAAAEPAEPLTTTDDLGLPY